MGWFQSLTQRSRRPRSTAPFRPGVERLEDRRLPAGIFQQTNLVSDIAGMAAVTDPNLVNPWGLSASDTKEFWTSNNNSGTSTLYDGQGQPQSPGSPLVVQVPPATGVAPPGSPTGTVFNTLGSGFNVSEIVNGVTRTGSSVFLFDSEDGTISGWSPSV